MDVKDGVHVDLEKIKAIQEAHPKNVGKVHNDVNNYEEAPKEEREEELKGVQTRNMTKKDAEKEIEGRYQGRLVRGKLKALENEIR